MENQKIALPVAKVISLWAAIGVTSWAEFASFMAAIYSVLLVSEWFWKKLWKPFVISRGWIKDGDD